MFQYDEFDRYEDTMVQERRSWLDRLDWIGLRHEVETEARAEIALLGLGNAGKSTLFNSLRGWPAVPAAIKLGRQTEAFEEPMGLFTLFDLPEGAGLADGLLERLERASLLVYVLDGAVGSQNRASEDSVEAAVRPADVRWIGRLRATGCPLLVVLNKADLWAGCPRAALTTVERRLGVEVLPVSAYDSTEARHHFLGRMIEACPALAVPLGREMAVFRRALAQRLIRRAALLCGLVAIEPIPLVDLPVQVGAQVGLAARIGAMYGHPPTSDYSRELVFTGAGSVALRLLAQQAAKIVPIVGWMVSGLIAATTTWLLGQTMVAYFEGRVTHGSVRQMALDLWRERIKPWFGRALEALLRIVPVVRLWRWGRAVWRRRRANRRARRAVPGGVIWVCGNEETGEKE